MIQKYHSHVIIRTNRTMTNALTTPQSCYLSSTKWRLLYGTAADSITVYI